MLVTFYSTHTYDTNKVKEQEKDHFEYNRSICENEQGIISNFLIGRFISIVK